MQGSEDQEKRRGLEDDGVKGMGLGLGFGGVGVIYQRGKEVGLMGSPMAGNFFRYVQCRQQN